MHPKNSTAHRLYLVQFKALRAKTMPYSEVDALQRHIHVVLRTGPSHTQNTCTTQGSGKSVEFTAVGRQNMSWLLLLALLL